ncbi:MAG: lipopolysaccharide assembly protein LapA domain-containing protein [Leptolyngbyaceae cyanobacterium MO_188.B28]|nr:lipopolysaccharide assembly protein LapA domain-containing protein [Leptolyngbyaceae cyanobacterium MO_188.B28]
MAVFLIFALAIAFLAILFALQNNSAVTITLFVWQYQESLAIVLLMTLAIGAIIGLLAATPTMLRRGWRISRDRRRAEGLEEEIQAKTQLAAKQAEKTEAVRLRYQNLLQTLDLTDPVTDLLHRQSLNQVVAATLRQMAENSEEPHYDSLCVFLMAAERAQPEDTLDNTDQDELLWRAIAQTLQKQTQYDSWLYSDGYGRFACTVLGLQREAAVKYGESLQASLTQQAVHLKDGAGVEVYVSFGGSIVDRANSVDAQTLIEQAEKALIQSQQRGRNRFRLDSVNP